MGTKQVPQSYIHSCDGCDVVQRSEHVSRPKHWSDLTLSQDAYDYQGCAVADATVRRLLCNACTEKVAAAINATLSKSQ